jgi:16S rRNA (guanine1516-N2)-methyltransferase
MWLNIPMPTIKISYSNQSLKGDAEALAEKLGFPLLDISVDVKRESGADYLLQFNLDGLCLQSTQSKDHGPIRCNFDSAASTHRRKYGGGNGQSIARAVGVSGKFTPQILDLTAGLGGDAFVLAALGCRLTLLERNSIVYSLLNDGLQRAALAGIGDSALAEVVARIDLQEGDSLAYLQRLAPENSPDIIYLDPMFPTRKKSAKVKKEMQVFHGIVGADEDAAELLGLGLQIAKYRVVVKRSAAAGYLGEIAPSYSREGKTTRFDIYALQKLPC